VQEVGGYSLGVHEFGGVGGGWTILLFLILILLGAKAKFKKVLGGTGECFGGTRRSLLFEMVLGTLFAPGRHPF